MFYHYYMKLNSSFYLYNTYPLDLLFLYVLLISVLSFLYLCPICIHTYQLIHNSHINYRETKYLLKVLFNSLVNGQLSFLNIFDLKELNFSHPIFLWFHQMNLTLKSYYQVIIQVMILYLDDLKLLIIFFVLQYLRL